MAFAHSQNQTGQRHDLVEHLRGVAALAAGFGSRLAASEAAHYLGLWHDVGKFQPQFQAYLLACEQAPGGRGRGPDHKAAGATLAMTYQPGPAALLIQGHHGGLRDRTAFREWFARLHQVPAVGLALELARAAIPDLEPTGEIVFPAYLGASRLSHELFFRFLFSALVDADYLDTERHFDAATAAIRGSSVEFSDLWNRFAADQQAFAAEPPTAVNQVRRTVYEACLAAAEAPPGMFRLAVPTGGGKTRSALAFALRHALRHQLERIIVAVPYISITEQTAEVYRSIFGSGQPGQPIVLEHHSESPASHGEGDDFHDCQVWERLASENWDARIIVTTTVQLFESLFAAGPRPCRKLHRLARSVIILDEAQVLPSQLLTPILDVLRELTTHYNTSVVLSTATQPAFEVIPAFARTPMRNIIDDPAPLFRALRRVRYEWRQDQALSWSEIAEFLRADEQALAVMNTKKDAIALLTALNDPAALHLSTMLCGAHRRSVLAEVQRRLVAGRPCRLVSTQVIEAGVDLDFPVVIRALGPLDSIIQAAGRCNREGRLNEGHVIVVRPSEGGLPPGSYRHATGITRTLLAGADLDPNDPHLATAYFEQLFRQRDLDALKIQSLREQLKYPDVADKFRMIDDATVTVAVPYGTPAEQAQVRATLDQLRRQQGNARLLLRRIQPFLVALRQKPAEQYQRRGLITPVLEGLGEWHGAYDPILGLTGDDREPDALVI